MEDALESVGSLTSKAKEKLGKKKGAPRRAKPAKPKAPGTKEDGGAAQSSTAQRPGSLVSTDTSTSGATAHIFDARIKESKQRERQNFDVSTENPSRGSKKVGENLYGQNATEKEDDGRKGKRPVSADHSVQLEEVVGEESTDKKKKGKGKAEHKRKPMPNRPKTPEDFAELEKRLEEEEREERAALGLPTERKQPRERIDLGDPQEPDAAAFKYQKQPKFSWEYDEMGMWPTKVEEAPELPPPKERHLQAPRVRRDIGWRSIHRMARVKELEGTREVKKRNLPGITTWKGAENVNLAYQELGQEFQFKYFAEKINTLKDVRILNLNHNMIDNMRGIRLAKLRVLSIANNEIPSFRDLPGAPSLTDLNLRNNKITDFDGAYRFNKLTNLTLAGNPISDHKDYKAMVMAAFPRLLRLDGRFVRVPSEVATDFGGKRLSTASGSGSSKQMQEE